MSSKVAAKKCVVVVDPRFVVDFAVIVVVIDGEIVFSGVIIDVV